MGALVCGSSPSPFGLLYRVLWFPCSKTFPQLLYPLPPPAFILPGVQPSAGFSFMRAACYRVSFSLRRWLLSQPSRENPLAYPSSKGSTYEPGCWRRVFSFPDPPPLRWWNSSYPSGLVGWEGYSLLRSCLLPGFMISSFSSFWSSERGRCVVSFFFPLLLHSLSSCRGRAEAVVLVGPVRSPVLPFLD